MFCHLIADLVGIDPARLRDRSLIGGLLVAATGAAGIPARTVPVVQQTRNDGVAAILLLDGGHVSIHTFPDRRLLILDILSTEAFDGKKALDVFSRRLEPVEIRSETRDRGD